jgi:tetratricopeptide (TPR) repeat protein
MKASTSRVASNDGDPRSIDASSGAARGGGLSPARFWLLLSLLVTLATVQRALILDEYLRENPIAENPWSDGWVYWRWAEQIAGGKWIGDTPFLSLPLYPYLVGLLRAAGGGLATAAVVQSIIGILNGVLLACVARRRFGAWAGLLAAALFYALSEPANTAGRVLANALQLLLVTWLWGVWSRAAERESQRVGDGLLLGAAAGVLALAYPPALLLAVVLPLWVWWMGRWQRPAVGRALLCGAAAAVVISPATIHNYAVSGELIPISAHAGITLRQGNGPRATGLFTPIAGVSSDRLDMHEDAAKLYEKTYGRKGSWGEIDRHFRREAVRYWTEDPARTAALIWRKLYAFLSFRNYDEMMPLALEREYGVARRSVLAPLPTPWLLGAAGLAAVVACRRPRRWSPELALLALPLLTTLVFYYTPRYRLPAIPVLCGLTAYALTSFRTLRIPWPVVALASAAPPALTFVNQTIGLDNIEDARRTMQTQMSASQVFAGNRRMAAGKRDEAERRFRAALAIDDNNPLAHRQLGYFYCEVGRHEEAVHELRRALERYSNDPLIYRHLYHALAQLGRWRAAVETLRRLTTLEANRPDAQLALAWLLATCPDEPIRDGPQAVPIAERVAGRNRESEAEALDVLAAAQAECGRFDEALATAGRALAAARTAGRDALAGEIEMRMNDYRARRAVRAAPRPVSLDAP